MRWKVENSWGTEPGEKGYFVMSSGWFDQYVYQVVVRRDLLSPALQEARLLRAAAALEARAGDACAPTAPGFQSG